MIGAILFLLKPPPSSLLLYDESCDISGLKVSGVDEFVTEF